MEEQHAEKPWYLLFVTGCMGIDTALFPLVITIITITLKKGSYPFECKALISRSHY
jgi:hypothetical protein